MIKVTYQKGNGEIIEKYRQVYTSHKIGQTTCWGWKVMDIKYSFNGKYYSSYDYDKVTTKHFEKEKKLLFLKKQVKKVNKQIVYIMVLILFINEFSSMM